MPGKRKRNIGDNAIRTSITKRPRHTASPDLLSPLSDEILIRVLSLLSLSDLLNVAPVSSRFYHLSGDSQIWKRLYYLRFVLPRALRIPGFRDGTAREGKLRDSARKAIWADGRRGGWVDMKPDGDRDSRNWERQYKLRHNWSRGKCAVEELKVSRDPDYLDTESSHKMHVKVSEGIAITVDVATGLRAWDLKTRQLMAQISLDENGSAAAPSCAAIDDQHISNQFLDIALGFTDGSFGVWRLDARGRRIIRRYRHEKSSNGELIKVAFSHPYLLTATKSTLISLYNFREVQSRVRPSLDVEYEDESETERGSESEAARDSESHTERCSESGSLRSRSNAQGSNTKEAIALPAPYLLTSLKSHSSRAPLALSLRKTAAGTIASIAYTFSTVQGWSLGIQDLHLKPSASKLKTTPNITTTRLAYTIPVSSARPSFPSPPASHTRHDRIPASDGEDFDGPLNICYTHPYLLATLPDNTLILYLCTSNSSSLSISPGIRLWGHTSGISDAEITARGKAVSVSCRGEEIRVWELEGRAEGKSIEVRPTVKTLEGGEDASLFGTLPEVQWDDRRNWVGFDDEMVIVLKESRGKESLMVYDFT
ncbi:hypothetical protein F5Y15DRAFT_370147 [Xylariaceae sp. FL0016]|nr:hypothetical protein F5Y15DRAFT_370147 [Xylariaceae sp. FL0016]